MIEKNIRGDYGSFLRAVNEELGARLGEVIPFGQNVALLDFPYSDNPGDCAIWLGEKSYLAARGVVIRAQCDVGRYSSREIRALHPDGPILMHGGGNLGDLWPEHQEFRLRVLADFPDREIIQLPQSVQFSSSSSAADFSAAVRRHGRCHIFVRDQKSKDFLEGLQVASILAPDMAFGLSSLSRTTKSTTKVLVLARTDHESGGLRRRVEERILTLPGVTLEEWSMSRFESAHWALAKTPHRIRRRTASFGKLHQYSVRMSDPAYDKMARVPFEAALGQISSADFMLTDRLHAHILATLLDKPHAIVDNSYGKLSGVYRACTERSGLTTLFENIDDAIDFSLESVEIGTEE